MYTPGTKANSQRTPTKKDKPLGVHTYIRGWRKFHAKPVCFFIVFWWQKIGFENSLELYFYPFIIELFAQLQFTIEETIHTKAAVDMSRGVGGSIFLFSCEDCKGLVGNYCL